jgi:hypothetical protein
MPLIAYRRFEVKKLIGADHQMLAIPQRKSTDVQ